MPLFLPQNFTGNEVLLWTLTTANMNITTDQTFVKNYSFTNFLITRVRAANASTSLTLCAGGIYTATAKGGNALVAASQTYASLTGSTLGLDLTLAAVGSGVQSVGNLYLNLTTAQGGAATADLYIMGLALS